MEFNRGNLEPAEQELVDALEAGSVYGPETEDRDTWPVIRAETIRNLLRGVYQDVVPDPKGLRLRHVRIDGRIDLDHVETRIALELDKCDLPGGLTAVHARLAVLRIRRMTIDRPSAEEAVIYVEDLHLDELGLQGTTLVNSQGPALRGDRLVVAYGADFDEGFAATGHGDLGAIRLIRASIGGQLIFRGASVVNDAGPALQADGITAKSGAWLDRGFTATGHGEDGAIRLISASIEGQLVFRGATVTNDDGPALQADGITVASGVFFSGTFSASNSGLYGAVRMPGASIGGQLVLSGARVFALTEVGGATTVVLAGTDVGAHLAIDVPTLEQTTTTGRWDIDGLTYREYSENPDRWLKFLLSGTRRYSPQPYQQFAAVARARGDEKLTRKILIAQHDDLITRSRDQHDLLTGRQRTWQRMLKATVGYGYRTWRAAGWLVLVVGIAVVAAFTFGSNDWLWGLGWDWAAAALQQPTDSKAGDPGGPCRPVDLVVLGLETIPLIPLISGGADRCFVTNSLAGTTFLGISVGLKLAAWALAALFVAGYTNIVRKPGP